MLVWVDENGQICSEPPSAGNNEEIVAESIDVSVPKGGNKPKDTLKRGKISNFDEAKGFGFISSMLLVINNVFFHINDCSEDVKSGDKVEFKTEKSLKGLKAINIKKLAS